MLTKLKKYFFYHNIFQFKRDKLVITVNIKCDLWSLKRANLQNISLRCRTRPNEWGTQWDSNSFAKVQSNTPIFIWFLCLMVYQSSWGTSYPCRRKKKLFNSSLGLQEGYLFPKCPKVNVIAQLELEHAYFETAVQTFKSFTIRITSSLKESRMSRIYKGLIHLFILTARQAVWGYFMPWGQGISFILFIKLSLTVTQG